MAMEPTPPTPLQLSPLLQNLTTWLTPPDLSTSVAPAVGTSAGPAGAASNALRQAGGLLGLLPGRLASTAEENLPGLPTSESKPPKRVRCKCAEAYGQNLYMGTSDGQVLWYTLDAVGSSADPYTLRHRHTLFPKRSVDRIFLLPTINKCLVLSEGTLHFLTLPSLDPIPPALIQPLRGVVAVAIDEQQTFYAGDGTGEDVGLCVIKRRGIGVYRLGGRLFSVRSEIPLPSPPLLAKYVSPTVCIADLEVYSFLSLNEATLSPVLPVTQVAPEDQSFVAKPVIAVVQQDEFLVSSCNGTGAIGVFLNSEGDPVRGTIDWESAPRSVAIHPPYIVALLRNQTIQVHSLLDLSLIQTLAVPPGTDARTLARAPSGFQVPASERDALLTKVPIPLLPPPALPPSPPEVIVDAEATPRPTNEALVTSSFDPPSGSGLTPPSSPRRSYNSNRTSGSSFSFAQSSLNDGGERSFQLSHILLVSPSSTHSLTPIAPVSLAIRSLSSSPSALSDALAPLVLAASVSGEQDVAALRFIHQKVFLRALKEARFGAEQGEIWAFSGGDVRLLVRLFAELREVLELERNKSEAAEEWRKQDRLEVEVEEGLKEEWEGLWDLEEIITDNLRRNYAPHIEPDVESSPSTGELRTALLSLARGMLRGILEQERKNRGGRNKGHGQGKKRTRTRKEEVLDRVVDTALIILLARIGTTAELLEVLESENYADPGLVQKALRKEGRWYALGRCLSGVDALEVFTKLADGETPDDDCPRDPVDEVLAILAASEDVPLVRKYGLWVVRRDWERGLELFVNSGLDFDHEGLVDELRALDDQAGDRYLEHVVVVKKSFDRELHTSLGVRYVELLMQRLKDIAVQEELRASLERFSSTSPPTTSFLAYLAATLPDSPHKRLRFKTILFLQGSPFYDVDLVHEKLEKDPAVPYLSFERAIIFGKLRMHDQALSILARSIGDAASAEAYCTQGGEVVPAHVGQSLARELGLERWAELGGGAHRRRMTVSEELTKSLLMILVGIYMGQGQGPATEKKTARLLNDQAVHLDVVDVLELVPEAWELEPIASFFTRSVRRTLHDRHEGQILKALSASANLTTMDAALATFATYPAVVVHPDGGMNVTEGGDGDEEKRRVVEMLVEKSGHVLCEVGVGIGVDSKEVVVREVKEDELAPKERPGEVQEGEGEEGLA